MRTYGPTVSRAENFSRGYTTNDASKIPVTKFVKYLRKDAPVQKTAIPSSFQPTVIVKELSEAGKAALEAQNSAG